MRTRRLVAIGSLGLVALAGCGSSGSNAGSGGGGAYGGGTPSTTAAKGSAATGATVSLSTGGGTEHLVGPNGHTLYLFERDQGTTTACTGACVDNWPALVADGSPTAGPGAQADLLGTADGEAPDQVTYHGHLLYYFAGDTAAGDVNGTAVPDWYTVDAAGNAIGG